MEQFKNIYSLYLNVLIAYKIETLKTMEYIFFSSESHYEGI